MVTNQPSSITLADYQDAEGNIDVNFDQSDTDFLRRDIQVQVPTGQPLSTLFDHQIHTASSTSSTRIGPEQRDGFLYFSDQDTRINYLTLKADENNQEGRENGSIPGQQRKTRLSFEVHDSMIFDDMMSHDLDESSDSTDDPVVDFLQRIVDGNASESIHRQEYEQTLRDVLGL
ncbi:hypothetical protein ACHAXS_012246 [Conticribra weissflogii]